MGRSCSCLIELTRRKGAYFRELTGRAVQGRGPIESLSAHESSSRNLFFSAAPGFDHRLTGIDLFWTDRSITTRRGTESIAM
jgi:hypothetical protein